jgi:hypothetical protein
MAAVQGVHNLMLELGCGLVRRMRGESEHGEGSEKCVDRIRRDGMS